MSDGKTSREVADEYLREEFGIGIGDLDTPGQSRLQRERDLYERQAEVAESWLKMIGSALNEDRPLTALRAVNEALDRIENTDEEINRLRVGQEGDDD